MKILLVRHAEAVDAHQAGSDSRRWLTREGRHTARAVAEALRAVGPFPGRLLSSPLVRAVQTAELLAAGLGHDGPVESRHVLAGGTTADIAALVQDDPSADSLVLVGHEPSIRVTAGFLVGESLPAFATGAACMVDWTGDEGTLEWLLDPRTMERITRPV